MEITLTSKKGRSNISTVIEVDDLKSEENLQEVFVSVVDFLCALGAEFPDELLDIIEEYHND